MTTPTATIYVPYHAIDELHQRGPRASQPAATTVVPGTLYCVTDEGDVVERSNGTAWEAYSPVPSGPVVEYDYTTATTAPPATREIRFNAAHPYTSVTTIWVRVLTANGTDVRAALAAQPAGVTLYVQQKDDATRYGKFQTTAEGVDQGDYFAFAVTWVANGAAIVNNQPVAVQFAGGGGGGGGTGDVTGPASAVDHSVALYSGTTGKLLTDASQVTVDGATGNVTTPGSVTAGGLATTPLNASNLTSGTVPDARFPATLPIASGVNLTNLNATNLASGTVADARLSSNVARRDVANTFVADQTVNTNVKIAGNLAVGGAALGTSNVARTDAANVFSGNPQEFKSGTPYLAWNDLLQPSGARAFIVQNTNQLLNFSSYNDDYTTAVIDRVLSLARNGNVSVAGDLSEKQRTTPIGHWIDVPFNAANYTASSGTIGSINQLNYSYSLIGKTLIVVLYCSLTPSVATTWIYVNLPTGIVNSGRTAAAPIHYTSGSSPGCGLMNMASGATKFGLLRDPGGTQWPAIGTYIAMNAHIDIT
jgi:hypothetical protein